jgi:dihydrofolate reductase
MRKLIAGMKVSIDGKITGPEGNADWVEAWSDDYGLMQNIDACLLGAGMYPEYEEYWTSIKNDPDKSVWADKLPTAKEIEYANFAAQTPHYVLSSTLTSALWPQTSFLRGLDEIAALKQRPGKDIYLVGGARTTASLIEAGLVDELRLIFYPIIAGDGTALFATTERRSGLELRTTQQLDGGLLSLTYDVANAAG